MTKQTDTPANGTAANHPDPRDVPPRRPAAAANDLIAAAIQPGIDPCDVACEAMPAQLVGDLTRGETTWLLNHTAICGECATELQRFERVGGALDQLHERRQPHTPPPVARLPRRPRAGYTRVESPVGPLYVAASAAGICEIDFAVHDAFPVFIERLQRRGFEPLPLPRQTGEGSRSSEQEMIALAVRQLQEYFAGHRAQFDLRLDFSGISPFTRTVLEATADVPFGRLETYRTIAQRVGKPQATRAVGNALGRNPLPIVCPCHRIIRSDHTLGGYTGGLQIKQHLLAVEGVALP